MARKKENTKLCQKCHRLNRPRAKSCISCGYTKFAPDYVRQLEEVTRQTYVQVTKPIEGEKPMITLYKWWPGTDTTPGGTRTFNIKNAEQWEKIKQIIDVKFSKFLGWKSKREILKDIKQAEKEERISTRTIKSFTKNQKLITTLLKEIDFSKVEESDYPELVDGIKTILDVLTKADRGFGIAFNEVLKQLPKQQKRAIDDLNSLLNSWSLKQITSISYQVKERLDTIKLFKKSILDDRTFELQGRTSIHRILERAMWIVDERYWLLHSNKTLRTIVQKKINQKYGKRRPDFVCGTVDNKLIIIEIKKPSHTLNVEDLNQLETYFKIIEDHHNISQFEAYLVGKKISADLKKTLKYRDKKFKIRTYTELIGDTEQRYRDYLKEIEE